MEGFFRKLLRIDLSNQSWTWETIPGNLIEDYLGGKGMGTLFLTQETPPGIDSSDPKNPIIFSNVTFQFTVPAAMGFLPNRPRREGISNAMAVEGQRFSFPERGMILSS
jgi:hypothetical protein